MFKCCFIHLKNSSIAQRDLYNLAISSASKSNRLVNKCSSLPFESSTFSKRNTFSARFCGVPMTTISSDIIVDFSGNLKFSITRVTAFFRKRDTKNSHRLSCGQIAHNPSNHGQIRTCILYHRSELQAAHDHVRPH